jgi:transposase
MTNDINGDHRIVEAILVIARDADHWIALMRIAGRHTICPYDIDHHGVRSRIKASDEYPSGYLSNTCHDTIIVVHSV